MKKCVLCDKVETDSRSSCSNCGAYLVSLSDKPKEQVPSVNEMRIIRKCTCCGKENYGGRLKCVDCDAELEKMPYSVTPKKDIPLGGGHVLGALATAALVILCFCFAKWSYESMFPYSARCPDFFPLIYPGELGVVFMLIFGGLGLFTLVILINLLSKHRWAGEKVYFPYAFVAAVLSTVEIYDKWIWHRSDKLEMFSHDSLQMWLVVGLIVVIGMIVDRFYKTCLECMVEESTEDEAVSDEDDY